MIKFSGNVAICTLLDTTYIFEEANGERNTYIFPGPFGHDSWTFMDPEDAERWYSAFDVLVMKLWVDYGRDPWSWTRDDVYDLLESINDNEIRALFVYDMVRDVPPESLCAFAHKFPEAFYRVNPDWVRKYNQKFQPVEP